MNVNPDLHAALLGGATVAGLVFSGIILARNPRSTPARMHAVYGGVVAWWFFCMAMVAISASTEQVQLWGRLVQPALGMLPAVTFHLNISTAGVAHEHRARIRLHYAASVALSLFCVTWPHLLASPHHYAWGPYVAFTPWGLALPAFLLVTLAEVMGIQRKAMRKAVPGSAYREKISAFYRGNVVALLALVDFLPAFGFAVYPFGFVILTLMHALTVFGSIRYRLIEITPGFAAEQILELLPDGVLVVDSQGLVRVANSAAAKVFDASVRDLIDRPVGTVVSNPEMRRAFESPQPTPTPAQEIHFETQAGEPGCVSLSGELLRDQKREPIARVWVMHDLTQQRHAEAEKDRLEGWVRHGQKLETLGVVAGGIAHDFNNLLVGILGSADLALNKLADGQPVTDELRTIGMAAERAAELTDQMLTYAGRGATVAVPVDLNALARDLAKLMGTAVSKKARLDLQLADRLPMVIADRSQMSQIILNLVTNASDALEDEPGTITIRTGTLQPGPGADEPELVFLEVTDTGVGIDEPTKERMFDPFFSTKFAGRGLGLATLLGIVEAHQGRIRVDTEPGKGTRVTVALPAATDSAIDAAATQPVDVPAWVGSGVALLVDDEDEVRRIAREMLQNSGFDVTEVADGRQAVAALRDHRSSVSLVLLDVTMPEMDGREALREIRALDRSVPIILMSGYSDASVADLVTDRRTAFLHKPFRSTALARALGTVLADGRD